MTTKRPLTPDINKDKARCLAGLLVEPRCLGPSPYVHFVPDKTCVIPSHLASRDLVIFEIGYDMPIPVPDLVLDDLGIRGTLSFSGRPFHCTIPWASIVALTCHRRNLAFRYQPRLIALPSVQERSSTLPRGRLSLVSNRMKR